MNLYRITIDVIVAANSDFVAESIVARVLEDRSQRYKLVRTHELRSPVEIRGFEDTVPLSAHGKVRNTVADIFTPKEPETLRMF